MEYVLVLALVVIPLAIMADMVIVFPWSALSPQAQQINNGSANPAGKRTIMNAYFQRMSTVISMPVG